MTSKHIVLVLGLVVLSACGERVVYVYPDGGQQTPADDAGGLADAPEVPQDGSDASAPVQDAGMWVEGTCNPDRASGAVSHVDCRGLDAPVCDAITEECETLPAASCDACETDVQCRDGVSGRADCVFMPGDAEFNNDSACLFACSTDADCGFLGLPYQCETFPRGSYCAPLVGDWAHCRVSDERGTHRISR